MKKLTILIGLFFSVNCYSQKDSLPPIPDSIQFMSKNHIIQSWKNLNEKLKPLEDKLTVSQYNRLVEGIHAAYDELITIATEDYRKKKKK